MKKKTMRKNDIFLLLGVITVAVMCLGIQFLMPALLFWGADEHPIQQFFNAFSVIPGGERYFEVIEVIH